MKRIFNLLCLIFLPLIAGTITKTITFSESEFSFKKIDGHDVVSLSAENTINELGNPMLPKKSITFLIPPDAEITDINLIDKDEKELSGQYNIYPVQKPIFLSYPELYEFTPPDEEVYTNDRSYPDKYFRFYPSGSKSGFRLAGVDIYPLHYLPTQKKLVLTKTITIQVEYSNGIHSVIPLTNLQNKTFSPEVAHLVINPEDLTRFSPSIRRNINDVNYVIITDDALASSFQSLVDWRTKQGWRTEVKTTNWIYTNYPGYDNEERIRNFIKDYFINKGLIWVLLGGDADLVPVRAAYLPEVNCPYSDTVTTDLYYADLDGTWDANDNHFYGEFAGDSVDLYADVFLGRIPVNTPDNVANYLSKENIYEKNPPVNYLKKMLLPSIMLIPLLNYHGRVVNNAIADITPIGWLDAKIEDPASGTVRDSLSAGYHFCHPATHGDYDGFFYASGNPVFNISEVASLTNGTKYNITNSIACLCGNFDEFECIAESLINKYPGACVAAIMNTRLGIGQRGFMGPSELLDLKFYDWFFNEDFIEIGPCHCRSKEKYINDILTEPHWRYCGYELTLFGDPALPMWQDVPVSMTVNHPQMVPMGSSYFEVSVKKGIFPIVNALVCLMGKADTCLYGVGYTNTSGTASILITSCIPLDTMWVTVTGQNHYPYEGFAIVDSGMPIMPKIIKPFNYVRLPDFQPILNFYSTDPQGQGIQYRVLWDSDPNFATPESITTAIYPSGDTLDFVFPLPLVDEETYWWRVKCTDPAGSNYWTQYTPKTSFTISTGIPASTCTWFQTTGAQFGTNNFNGTMVQGDSVILVPYGETVLDTIFQEDFEAGGIPLGWTVIDGNNDGLRWGVGISLYLRPLYYPPNHGTKYAFFEGDTDNVITYNEELISPAIYIGSINTSLEIMYSYTFSPQDGGCEYQLKMRKKIGSNWGSWQVIKNHEPYSLGIETINLTSYLPADSIQFSWFYKDNITQWMSGVCACDNVVLRYLYAPTNNSGVMTGVGVNYRDLSIVYPRTGWGDVVWHKAAPGDSIGIQVEYQDSLAWHFIPDSDLPGNSIGFYTPLAIDSVDIHNLDTLIYHTLRLKTLFYRKTGRVPDDPALLDWEIGNPASYGIMEQSRVPKIENYRLEVYPNPFCDKIDIRYSPAPPCGARPGILDTRYSLHDISIKIYDATGRLVKSFPLTTDYYLLSTSVSWFGDDDKGCVVPAGVYFMSLEISDYKKVEKVILLR